MGLQIHGLQLVEWVDGAGSRGWIKKSLVADGAETREIVKLRKFCNAKLVVSQCHK